MDTLGQIVYLEQIGRYRDDVLIFILDRNGLKTSNIHKTIVRTFSLR